VHTLDASSIIHAWDNYPQSLFPSLWKWIAAQISDRKLDICGENLEEVKNVAPECEKWLRQNSIVVIHVSNSLLAEAAKIKNVLEIANDNFHPKGVDQNDLFAIAAARISGSTLISNEAIQATPPTERRKRKIPAVCKLDDVRVICIDFLTYIKVNAKSFE
jgi:chemotaxis signal transduction protein